MGETSTLLKESEDEVGTGDTGVEHYKEQIGFNLLSTLTEGVQGQPSDQAIGPQAGGQRGLPGGGGVGCELGPGQRCWIGLE